MNKSKHKKIIIIKSRTILQSKNFWNSIFCCMIFTFISIFSWICQIPNTTNYEINQNIMLNQYPRAFQFISFHFMMLNMQHQKCKKVTHISKHILLHICWQFGVRWSMAKWEMDGFIKDQFEEVCLGKFNFKAKETLFKTLLEFLILQKNSTDYSLSDSNNHKIVVLTASIKFMS
jgi:hypothetical protein